MPAETVRTCSVFGCGNTLPCVVHYREADRLHADVLVQKAEALVAERLEARVVEHLATKLYEELRGPVPPSGDIPLQAEVRRLEAELKEAADSLFSAAKVFKDLGHGKVANRAYQAGQRAQQAAGEGS